MKRERMMTAGAVLRSENQLLSARQVAVLLGIGLRTWWRWQAREGMPRQRRLGNRTVRWDRHEILVWANIAKPQAYDRS